jgi:hypothetical protein
MKIIRSFFDQIYNLFLWSSGADLKILEQAPMDKNKYYGIGGTIVFTALMATFAGGYAFYTAFNDQTLSIFFGFFWGALIFNLDRYIVSSFGVGDGKKTISGQEFLDALPRLVMAIILGLVIATPLELKLFEKEINSEIARLNDKTTSELESGILANADSMSITYRQEIVGLKGEIEDRRNYLDLLREKRSTAYDSYMCELNGTCGTGLKGEGPVFREAKENYFRLNDEYQQLEVLYSQRNNDDFENIKKKEGEVELILARARQDIARLKNEYSSRDGLLARLEALGTLTSADQSLWAAKWLITLLFVFIEIAPILFKMMTERGPYDDILDRKKYEIKVQQLLIQSNINEEINMEVKINSEKSAQKLEAELLANKELMNHIVKAQAEIAGAAIDEWKKKQIEVVKKNPEIIITSS